MKSLLFTLLFAFPHLLWGQDTLSRPQLKERKGKTFFSIGYCVIPFSGSPLIPNAHITNSERAKPVTMKLEKFVFKFMSIGLNLNYSKYKLEYDADLTSSSQTKRYHFVQQDGRLALNGRLNVGRAKENYSWYFGLGLGLRLKDYYNFITTPNPPYDSGRDSDGIPVGAELSGGFRLFPFKKARGLGFYADAGLTQSLLQLGITFRNL